LVNLRGNVVSYIAQSALASFNPALRINEQVIESSLTHSLMSKAEAKARAQQLYEELALPNADRIGQAFPHEVSGGQLQRLMAAMAVCARPRLLILDEPTSALDVTTQIEVLKAFKDLIKTERTAAIYVTHDLAVVAQIADRAIVLRGGEIQETGKIDQILHRPANGYTKSLIAAIRPPPQSGRVHEVTRRTPSESIVEIEGLTAGYGRLDRAGNPRVPVLSDIDLTIRRSSVLGVIGESGSGKSTLARVLAGLLPWSKGEVGLDGAPLPPLANARSRDQLRRIQIVFQMADTALNPRQKIGAILSRPLEFYHGKTGSALSSRVTELLDMVRLPSAFKERYPSELSGGQKQRINLARALAAEPTLVLCDEVTSALDAVVGAAIIELLRELRRELGVAFMFISHDISTVASFADEIAVLYAGRLVEHGPTDRVLAFPRHPYSDLLISSVPEMRAGWLEASTSMRRVSSDLAGLSILASRGCAFAGRCPMRIAGVCEIQRPPVRIGEKSLAIYCHRTLDELGMRRAMAPAT
jgi:peptide/nickel transport system ATP-binding protein